MLKLEVSEYKIIESVKERSFPDFTLNAKSQPLEEKVKLLILRDLSQLNWTINIKGNKIEVLPPNYYDKSTIRRAMSIKRDEIIQNNRVWINNHLELARQNLADGLDVYYSKIKPIIEVCEKEKQHRLFRVLRYYWSSPYSEYVGRRIKLIIRDAALSNKPVIGIAALGSPIIHIPERDEWIGWDTRIRTNNLNYTMDAYVIGALPPYNYILGGKLISYILASNEVRKIYRDKYKDKITLISKKKADKLVGIFTTSLYGKSSQYNRIKYHDEILYEPIGETKGYGTLHLTRETLTAMQEFVIAKGININNNFGDGPSWTMRLISKAGELLNFDPDFLLKHSFKRKVYYVSLAENSLDFLNGKTRKIKYYNYTMRDLVKFWKNRWLYSRKNNTKIMDEMKWFKKEDFFI